jgi:hypothetical protein
MTYSAVERRLNNPLVPDAIEEVVLIGHQDYANLKLRQSKFEE